MLIVEELIEQKLKKRGNPTKESFSIKLLSL